MRRTALLGCAFALLLAGFGGPAFAAPQSPNATFELQCVTEGITASGTVAGWYGMFRIAEADGVAVPSVAVVFSFTQATWENPSTIPPTEDPTGIGVRELAGVRPPGTLYGCAATMEWDFLGVHYYAELSDLEVLIARLG